MPRRRRLRKIVAPPQFTGFKPYGANDVSKEFVELLYEEYEAVKLADYDLMNHEEASGLMGVSRPTFARIYESARRKIAQALVETKEIKTVFGNAWMDKNWFVCGSCHARFTIPKTIKECRCALCSSVNIKPINDSK
jgi:LSD1 subclass zinc finger protein